MAEILESFEDLLDDNNQITTEDNNLEDPNLQTTVEDNNQEGDNQDNDNHDNDNPDYSDNSLYRFLQERGIKDPSKITFVNEDESTEEIDFNSLSADEQLDLLKQITDPGLSEIEINTINFLRQNNITIDQYADYIAQQKLDAYLNEHPDEKHQKKYYIDDYSDDDLYLVYLKNQYPDFTDEELLSKLDSAKDNQELFNKEVQVLRNNFKANEDQAEAEKAAQEQQMVEDLRNNLAKAAEGFSEIQLDYTDKESDTIVIDDEDKQQMMSYILDQDADGKSQLVKDLEDPDRLIELAWFSTQGAKVLSELTKYWKGLLSNERAENKKLQAKLDKLSKAEHSTVIRTPEKPEENKQISGGSIWDNSGLI